MVVLVVSKGGSKSGRVKVRVTVGGGKVDEERRVGSDVSVSKRVGDALTVESQSAATRRMHWTHPL